MIFKPEMVEAILSGAKTETRRPVKLTPNLQPDGWHGGRDGMFTWPCRYQEGHSYAVQPGRGKRGVARILVESVHREALGAITGEGARREGFAGRPAFFDYWRRLYGAAILSEPVWVIRFALLGEES